MTMTQSGISVGAGKQSIAPDASSNSFDLTVNGDIRNAKIWPFTYTG